MWEWRSQARSRAVIESRYRRRLWLRLLLASLIAALLHLPMLKAIFFLVGLDDHEPVSLPRFTEVSLISPKELPALRQKARQLEKKLRKEPKEEPEEEPKGQIVDLPVSRDSRRPDKARYLARWNSRTERETRKHGKPGDQKPKRRELTARKPSSRSFPAPSEQESLATIVPPRRVRSRRPHPGERPKPEASAPRSLVLPRSEASRLRLLDEALRELAVSGEHGRPEPSRETMRIPPRMGSYSELLPPVVSSLEEGNRGSDDYLPDLPDGDELSLNAREFKYWSYFQRVRRNLRQHWNPREKYRRRDPWGKIYGVRDRLTVLSVVLDDEGMLHDLQLVQGSGVGFLDEEAIRAFRLARSFPNPPSGLVETDGFIRFRFGFAVVHNVSGFNLFRYNF